MRCHGRFSTTTRTRAAKDTLKAAPAYAIDDLTKHDGEIRDKAYSFYKVDRDW